MVTHQHDRCILSAHCGAATCPAAQAARLRAQAVQGRWHALSFPPGGWQLAGKPLRCGDHIELQAIEERADERGSYPFYAQRGTLVSFELALGLPVLRVSLAGHTFTARVEDWMFFRWPVPRGDVLDDIRRRPIKLALLSKMWRESGTCNYCGGKEGTATEPARHTDWCPGMEALAEEERLQREAGRAT